MLHNLPQRAGLALFFWGIPAGLWAAGVAQPFTWWTTHSLEKVKPWDAVPRLPARSVELFAGRNEFEPFQIVVRAERKDLTGVDIQVSDFRSNEGAEISKSNVTVYFEAFVNLERPSTIQGGTGLWPDPLIPRVDRYVNERRGAFPFAVRRGRNQPLWIEVFVPETARPGKYTGSATVSLGGAAQFTVPIHLTVWQFVLPSTATLKSSFGLSGISAVKQHRGGYTNEEDLHSITRLYAKAALLHRISIHGGSMVPPKFSYEAGKMQIDWRAYDEEVGPFLNGAAMAEGEPLRGARATSVEIRGPASFPAEEQQRLYWKEWVRHFEQKGWLDRLFLYLWDEPPSSAYPEVFKRGRLAIQADPRVRNLVTVPFNRRLEEVVQIWVPLVNCLETKPGSEDFCRDTPPIEAYAGEERQGKSLWFYQSCASHGCNIVGGQYFTGWPSYMIDTPGAANRVMQWVAWKLKIAGELYYSMNEAYAHAKDPWTNIRLSGGNGDGTLFYPGRPDRVGGRSDIPIESIRLKLIREGMEDYEYLTLLARLDGRKSADEYANRIVQRSYQWEPHAEPFLKVRQELGEALNRLAPAQPIRETRAQ